LTPVKLSRESEYGLEGLRVLARRPDGTVMLLQEIAAAGNLPARFLAKIFQKLVRRGLLRSHRGAVRGYSLARPSASISAHEVLQAVEGDDLFERCAFWPSRCNEARPCILHHEWNSRLRPAFKEVLEGLTLERIAAEPSRPLRALGTTATVGARRRDAGKEER